VPARRLIPELALKARLPSVFHHAQWAEVGGLMFLRLQLPPDVAQRRQHGREDPARRQGGGHPDGATHTYELAINAATARKLGIRIPESIRVRVDRVIDH
jgi:hypothetical protein